MCYKWQVESMLLVCLHGMHILWSILLALYALGTFDVKIMLCLQLQSRAISIENKYVLAFFSKFADSVKFAGWETGAHKPFKCNTGWKDTAHMECFGKQRICITTVKTNKKLMTWQKTWLTVFCIWISCLCLTYMYVLNVCVHTIIQLNVFMGVIWRCIVCPVKRACSTCIWGLEWDLGCGGKTTCRPRSAPECIKICKVCICVGILCRWRLCQDEVQTDEQKDTMRG